mmetsp:Transcript_93695/g.214325  ORF Transcript_93695/g.214325 Transcript_93695/m.214325 type:complete len:285 (-) Transcript_93695:611-1465(-)
MRMRSSRLISIYFWCTSRSSALFARLFLRFRDLLSARPVLWSVCSPSDPALDSAEDGAALGSRLASLPSSFRRRRLRPPPPSGPSDAARDAADAGLDPTTTRLLLDRWSGARPPTRLAASRGSRAEPSLADSGNATGRVPVAPRLLDDGARGAWYPTRCLDADRAGPLPARPSGVSSSMPDASVRCASLPLASTSGSSPAPDRLRRRRLAFSFACSSGSDWFPSDGAAVGSSDRFFFRAVPRNSRKVRAPVFFTLRPRKAVLVSIPAIISQSTPNLFNPVLNSE